MSEMKFIPQMEPWFGEEETKGMLDYMSAGGWLTEFKKTEEFEKEIASFTGSNFCVVTNNGTISLSLAAMALGIKAGDEVIVPNYTMIATPNSLRLFGAKPVFCDVEESTLCMDLEKAKELVTEKTKAIIFVAANGRYPVQGIQAFEEFALKNNLLLIEDAAQALGSYYPDGRHIGTVGLVGSFSFSVPKVITTGQGGAIITDSEEIYKQLRLLKDFGRTSGGNDIHDHIGWNFKYTDLQAVIGLEQIKKLRYRVQRKKEIYALYKKELVSVEQVFFFDQNLEYTTPWFIDILADNREELQAYLKVNGIGARVMYPPINQQKAYGVPGSFPVSEKVGEKGLWLPSASQLSDEQVTYICEKIQKFYNDSK